MSQFKSLREMELENELIAARHRILELEHKVGVFQSSFVTSKIEEAVLALPLLPVLRANLGIDSSYDPKNGWETCAWRYGKDRLEYRYYSQFPISDYELPYVLDMEHERFTFALLGFLKKREQELREIKKINMSIDAK